MGMRQRLGLAAALLADPEVLILDEPANGLDPEGINWLRGFLRHLAGEGRTVLVSSHMLSEVQQTVDNIVIIASGRLVRSGSLRELMATSTAGIRVRSPHADRLHEALEAAGIRSTRGSDGVLLVEDPDLARIGSLAFSHQVELHELAREDTDLEQIFLQLTADQGGIR
jgi:ABC-2 type transport system ATP-binding protein